MRHLLILALSVSFLVPVLSQPAANHNAIDLDSLEREIPRMQGADQIKALLRLSQEYSRKSLEKSIEYAERAKFMAQEQQDFSQLVIAYDLLGQGNSRLGNHLFSMSLFESGLRYARQLGNTQKEAHLMNSIGIEYAKTGDYEKALSCLLSALEMWRNMADREQTAITLNNIGLLQLKLDRPEPAIKTLEAMNTIGQQNQNQDILSTSWNNLGQVYQNLGEYDRALDYYKQALEVKKKFGRPMATLPSYSNIFSIYSYLQQSDSAMSYYQIAWGIAEKQKSKEWLQKLLEIRGDAALQQGQTAQARIYFLQSKTYADSLGSEVTLVELERKLGDAYAGMNRFDSAFQYYQAYARRKESIYKANQLSQLAELQAKYDLNEKDLKIEHYKREELISQYRMAILIVAIVLSLAALLAIFSRYRIKQQAAVQLKKRNEAIEEKNEQLQKKSHEILAKNKMLQSQSEAIQVQNQRLAQSNADLERFAFVASHDLREPLRTIRSYMQLLEKRYGGRLDESAMEFIHFAANGAVRMDELLRDLMEYSRVGRTESQKRLINLNLTMERVIDSLTVQIAENAAKITYAPLPSIFAYESEMHQLFQNLISNAIKFRREEPPEIRIGVREEEGSYLFFVADNGIGIPEGQQERVFTPFLRLHPQEQYEGTGIGLAICYKIVQTHGGSIRYESVPGKGTIFYVSLPVNSISSRSDTPHLVN